MGEGRGAHTSGCGRERASLYSPPSSLQPSPQRLAKPTHNNDINTRILIIPEHRPSPDSYTNNTWLRTGGSYTLLFSSTMKPFDEKLASERVGDGGDPWGAAAPARPQSRVIISAGRSGEAGRVGARTLPEEEPADRGNCRSPPRYRGRHCGAPSEAFKNTSGKEACDKATT